MVLSKRGEEIYNGDMLTDEEISLVSENVRCKVHADFDLFFGTFTNALLCFQECTPLEKYKEHSCAVCGVNAIGDMRTAYEQQLEVMLKEILETLLGEDKSENHAFCVACNTQLHTTGSKR